MTKTTFALLLAVALTSGISAQTFTENHNINCGDTIAIGGLGYPTWAIPEITQLPKHGYAKLLGDFIPANLLEYQAPQYFIGLDTVVIKCAHATQITCDTGIYVFNVGCSTVHETITVQVACNDTAIIENLSGFAVPQIIEQPQHGQATVTFAPTDQAILTYIPDPSFEGPDNVLLSLFNGLDTVNYLFLVYCFLPTGTDNGPAIRHLSFFPQPAANTVYADGFFESIKSVQVSDMTGRTISTNHTFTGDRLTLDVSALTPGIYTAKIYSTNGVIWAGKILK